LTTILVRPEIGGDTVEQQYFSNLTREPYFYYELKQVAKLTLAGLSPVEIRTKIKDENLFQCTTNKGINRLLSATHKRVAVLDKIMLNLLVHGSLHTSKLVALIAIMKTNRLFLEFIEEVYLEKLRLGEQELEPRDIRIFFNNKAEQSPKVAGWQESTIKKLSQVYSMILCEAGLINNTHKKRLTPPTIEEELLVHLRKIGDHRFIIAMTGGRM
jgi:molybdenum cofactor biosynthesis enzyme MoaA